MVVTDETHRVTVGKHICFNWKHDAQCVTEAHCIAPNQGLKTHTENRLPDILYDVRCFANRTT